MAKHIRPMVHRKGGKSREIGDGGSDDGHGAGSDAGYSPAHGGVVKGKVRGWRACCVALLCMRCMCGRWAGQEGERPRCQQPTTCAPGCRRAAMHPSSPHSAASPCSSSPVPLCTAGLPHLVLRLPAAHRLHHLPPAGVCHHSGPRLCPALPLLVHQVPAGPCAGAHVANHVPPLLWPHGEQRAAQGWGAQAGGCWGMGCTAGTGAGHRGVRTARRLALRLTLPLTLPPSSLSLPLHPNRS